MEASEFFDLIEFLRGTAAMLRVADRFKIENENMSLAAPEDKDEPEGKLLVLMSDTLANELKKKLEGYADKLENFLQNVEMEESKNDKPM